MSSSQGLPRRKAPLGSRSFSSKEKRHWTTDDVCEWLDSLGLGEYSLKFVLEDINGMKLRTMTDEGLKKVGIIRESHRKRIIQALLEDLSETSSSETETLSISQPKNKELYLKINRFKDTDGFRRDELLASSSASDHDDPITIKAHYQSEVRTATVSANSTFSYVKSIINGLFDLKSRRQLKYRYIDSDGDRTSIVDNEDWRECVASAGTRVAIYIEEDMRRTASPTAPRHTKSNRRTTRYLSKSADSSDLFRNVCSPSSALVPRTTSSLAPEMKSDPPPKIRESLKSSRKSGLKGKSHKDLFALVSEAVFSPLNNLTQPTIVIDDKGIIQFVNDYMEKMSGYMKSELLGHNISILMTRDMALEHDKYIESYVATGISKIIGKHREVLMINKHGQIKSVTVAVTENYSTGTRMFVGTFGESSFSGRRSSVSSTMDSPLVASTSSLFERASPNGQRKAPRNGTETMRLLANGPNGTLFLVESTGSNGKKTDRIVHKILTKTPQLEDSVLLREYVKNSMYSHKNITAIIRDPQLIEYPHKGLCLAFEYADEGNLWEVLSKSKKGGLSLEWKHSVMLSMTEGLGYLHEMSLLHGNLKPTNVMFFSDPPAVKLSDWYGSSHLVNVAIKSHAADRVNQFFVPPEVMHGLEYTKASDIFALGLLYLYVLSGDENFPNAAPVQIPATMLGVVWLPFVRNLLSGIVSSATVEMILKLMRELPKERSTAQELLAFLRSKDWT